VTERGRAAGWIGLVAALTSLAYAVRATEGKPPKDVLYQYSAAIGGLVQYSLILALVLALGRGPGMADRLGLRRPRSWPAALGLAFAALLSIYVVAYVLSFFLDPGREQGLTPSGWDGSRAPAFAANFVVVAGLAPVVEELAFRGLGFHVLRRLGEWPAILLVGLAFGIVHGLLDALPILVFFGTALAFVRSRTRSVYPGMLLHAVFNALALTVAVTT
jgi:membrane protease YdiL (CAAX protease family)